MPEFDFSKVQAVKSEKIPTVARVKVEKPNPLAGEYEKSLKTRDANGFGEWQCLELPGAPETVKVTSNEGKESEKVSYGPVVKKALGLLRSAAHSKNLGVSFRYELPTKENKIPAGHIRLHFQAKPKRGHTTV